MTLQSNHTATAVGGPCQLLTLYSHWTQAEFGVFGDGNLTDARFSPSSASLNVETGIANGTPFTPRCVDNGTTGETNDLNFGSNPPMLMANGGYGGYPTVQTQQSIGATGVPACARGFGHGDTHEQTFPYGDNLTYSFQGRGDDVDTTIGSAFTVEARQVSGAPASGRTQHSTRPLRRRSAATLSPCAPGRLGST